MRNLFESFFIDFHRTNNKEVEESSALNTPTGIEDATIDVHWPVT